MELEQKGTLATPRPAEKVPDYSAFFPREFEFFGQGIVRMIQAHCDLTECAPSPYIIAFQVTGDERGLCAVALERAPLDEDERSMLLELANVLASKLITQLADHGCADIMIGPPGVAADGESRHRYLRSTLLAGGTRGSAARAYRFEASRGLTLRLAYLPTHIGGTT